MADLTDLLAVYGAIDELVLADPDLVTTVGPLLAPYEQGAAGWFDATVGRPDTEPRRLPFVPAVAPRPMSTAIERLRAEPLPTEFASRLLLAFAAYGRARDAFRPSLHGGEPQTIPDEVLAPALTSVIPVQPDTHEVVESAPMDLMGLLRDKATYPDLASFPALFDEANRHDLMTSSVARQIVTPCLYSVIPETESGGPAMVFVVRLHVHGRSNQGVDAVRAKVVNILDPTQWPDFDPPWCDMAARVGAPAGQNRYREAVSWICPGGQGEPAEGPGIVITVLDFKRNDVNNPVGILEYRLAESQADGDGQVSVDEGSVVVFPVENAVEVITTKRVQFSAYRNMDAEEAAMWAQLIWTFGYAQMAERFVNRLSSGDGTLRIREIGSARRKSAVDGIETEDAGALAPLSSPCMKPETDIEDIFDECVSDIRSSLEKIAKGQYGVAAYLGDVLTLSRHAVQYSSRFLDLSSAAGSSGKKKKKKTSA